MKEVFHGTTENNAINIVNNGSYIPNSDGLVYVTTDFNNAKIYASDRSWPYGTGAVVYTYVKDELQLKPTSTLSEFETNATNLIPTHYTTI